MKTADTTVAASGSDIYAIEADLRRERREEGLTEEQRLEKERKRIVYTISAYEDPKPEAVEALRLREEQLLMERKGIIESVQTSVTSLSVLSYRLQEIDQELRNLQFDIGVFSDEPDWEALISAVPLTDTLEWPDLGVLDSPTALLAEVDEMACLHAELKARYRRHKAAGMFKVAEAMRVWTRLYVIARIGVRKLAGQTGLSTMTISRHLCDLRKLGVVTKVELHRVKIRVSGYRWTYRK